MSINNYIKIVKNTKKCYDDICFCPMRELLTNENFDEVIGSIPVGWTVEINPIGSLQILQFLPGYEGPRAVTVDATPEPGTKIFRIFQSVNVIPGSILQFSFFENLIFTDGTFERANLTGRVYYGDNTAYKSPNQTDLIRIERTLFSPSNEVSVFQFHQRVSNTPVPSNVTTVTAEISLEIVQVESQDTGLIRWLLDAASLRNVSPICIRNCR